MSNQAIQELIFRTGLRKWKIAEAMGIHEVTLSRWLRTELSDERREKVLAAIDRLTGEAEV